MLPGAGSDGIDLHLHAKAAVAGHSADEVPLPDGGERDDRVAVVMRDDGIGHLAGVEIGLRDLHNVVDDGYVPENYSIAEKSQGDIMLKLIPIKLFTRQVLFGTLNMSPRRKNAVTITDHKTYSDCLLGETLETMPRPASLSTYPSCRWEIPRCDWYILPC